MQVDGIRAGRLPDLDCPGAGCRNENKRGRNERTEGATLLARWCRLKWNLKWNSILYSRCE